ncbi:MAG: YceI family protein [Cyclobacteriaceae bacterium]
MKALLVGILFFGFLSHAVAQSKYIDRNGKASFFSSAPMEDIEAHNNQAVSILDVKSGEIVASMLMRSFNFRKALMEEHFNENYIESNKYPKSTFKGKVTNVEQFDVTKNGKYSLDVTGEITLHGVTQKINVKADAVVENGTIKAKAVFPLVVQDFKIEVPRLVRNNIAEKMEVTVSFNYQPMKP